MTGPISESTSVSSSETDWLRALIPIPSGTQWISFVARKSVDDFRGDIALDDIIVRSLSRVDATSTAGDRDSTTMTSVSTTEAASSAVSSAQGNQGNPCGVGVNREHLVFPSTV